MEKNVHKESRFPGTSFVRDLSIGGFLLLLACSGPSSHPLPEKAEMKGKGILHITGLNEKEWHSTKEELRAREEVLEILPSTSSQGELYVLVKAKGSEDLEELSFSGRTEELEKKELDKKLGDELEAPEVSHPGSGSNFELPNIFDFFTRIY